VIGNFFDLPAKEQWLKVTEWSKEYGEVVHLNAIGQHMIYLNTYEVAVDLLERRAAKYSDRVLTEMTKMIGADRMLAFMRYGDKWRTSRRMFHQEFNSNTATKFLDTQLKHGLTMLQHIYRDPESFEHHIKHFSSGTVLETVYGIEIQSKDDPYVRGVERAMENLEALVVGVYMVDFFPFLRYVPKWFPGASFKKNAWRYHQSLVDHYVLPFQAALEKMNHNEISHQTVTTRWMDRINDKPDEKERRRLEGYLQLVTGVTLIGGYETTTATLLIFIYLMITHPEVQTKIQAELDAVVGRSRLPDFSDQENLPYINAVYKELIRWYPILPLGIPHRAIMEDEYKGSRIPNESIIIPNVWVMVRDKTVYGSDADLFRPERFLESDLRDPARIVFGFGRRICPGRHFAENSLFLGMCLIPHLFKMGKALDKEGTEVPLEAQWTSGVVVHLEQYRCSITPRFESAGELLKSSEGVL